MQPNDIANQWREFFDSLLNVRGGDDLNEDVDLSTDSDEVFEEITEAEVLLAIARKKRGKATGEDDLPVEIVKEAGEEVHKHLLSIFRDAYTQEAVTPE